jgi:hypothetical protein
MAQVFVEPRPKGRKEGDQIDDYVVEDHADHVLHTAKTQEERSIGPRKRPLAALRHLYLNDKKTPNHWRAV